MPRLGKHVLCEKPIARTAEEAKEMVDAVTKDQGEEYGWFQLSFCTCYTIRSRHLIESGKLGQIYHCQGSLPSGMDYAAL